MTLLSYSFFPFISIPLLSSPLFPGITSHLRLFPLTVFRSTTSYSSSSRAFLSLPPLSIPYFLSLSAHLRFPLPALSSTSSPTLPPLPPRIPPPVHPLSPLHNPLSVSPFRYVVCPLEHTSSERRKCGEIDALGWSFERFGDIYFLGREESKILYYRLSGAYLN